VGAERSELIIPSFDDGFEFCFDSSFVSMVDAGDIADEKVCEGFSELLVVVGARRKVSEETGSK
jgi:hypothetical protein